MTEEDDLKVEWRWRGGAEKMTGSGRAGTARRPCRGWEVDRKRPEVDERQVVEHAICGIDGEN